MDTRYLKRQIINRFNLLMSILATVFGLFWLMWILVTLLQAGMSALHATVFTHMTQPPGSMGGLLNPIVGSIMMVVIAIIMGTPIGILAGIYLAEFGQYTHFGVVVRFINDVMLSAPSIIIGLFVYQVYVTRIGHFAGWAGCFALAIIVIPIVVRTTEDMCLMVPNSLREAASALGAARWRMILHIVLRVAKTGILTGILLALARISGETAPLLFTALNNQFWNVNLNQPMANLPTVIFQYAMSPYHEWHQLAWTGALIISFWVLVINIVVRAYFRHEQAIR